MTHALPPGKPPARGPDRRSSPQSLKRIGDHIGARIRRRRTELGLTQEQLGQALGVSYQQVQKYETAANRVSAGRLYELARECAVDVTYFFDGLDPNSPAGAMPHGGHNRAVIELARNFLALEDQCLQTAISGLLKALREKREAAAQAAATNS